jgi:hypothetical protein
LEIGSFGECALDVGFNVSKELTEIGCFERPVCVIAGDCGWVKLIGCAVWDGKLVCLIRFEMGMYCCDTKWGEFQSGNFLFH